MLQRGSRAGHEKISTIVCLEREGVGERRRDEGPDRKRIVSLFFVFVVRLWLLIIIVGLTLLNMSSKGRSHQVFQTSTKPTMKGLQASDRYPSTHGRTRTPLE